MVAAVGRPTQCQLAHVARADHQTVVLIRHIHQHQCADTRLCVLVGDVVNIDVMSYVAQVLCGHVADRYLVDAHAHLLHHLYRVVIGAVARTKPRHGHAYHLAAVIAQAVGSQYADDQRQCRV